MFDSLDGTSTSRQEMKRKHEAYKARLHKNQQVESSSKSRMSSKDIRVTEENVLNQRRQTGAGGSMDEVQGMSPGQIRRMLAEQKRGKA